MFDIPIYSAEKDIAELIQKSNSINHIVEVKEVTPFELPNGFVEKLTASNIEERKSVDLYYLQALLVSSVINGNDDYFTPYELWAAKNTVKDKPFNLEHDCDDIIGHTIGSYVIDDVGKLIDNNKTVDELPDTIHIIAGSVVYKKWSKEDKQKKIDNILGEIKSGSWFVSVECLFPTFDYALVSEKQELKLVARNEETSFLTKYLRIYGGAGVFKGEKIARVPRNLIISGKGLVKEPANKLSSIFAKQYQFSKNNVSTVYKILEVDNMEKFEKEYNDTKEKLDKLQTEYTQLKASLDENKTKDVQAKLDATIKSVEAKDQELNSLKSSVAQVAAEKDSLTKQVDELTKAKKEISDKLDKMEGEQRINARIQLCKDKLKLDDEKAKVYCDNVNLLPDEAFAKHIEFQAQFVTVASQSVKVTETVVPETKVLETVKETKTEVVTPELNVATASVNDKVSKLATEIASYRQERGFLKVVPSKVKQEAKK